MRFKTLALLAAVPMLSAPLSAQRLCEEVNPGVTLLASLVTRAPAWVVTKYTATQALTNVTGVELFLFANVTGMPVTVGIYDVDPVSGEPGTLLASGTATVNQERTFYAARMNTSVSIPLNSEYYVGAEIGVMTNGTAHHPYDRSTGLVGDMYLGGPGSWVANPFSATGSVSFRLYCGTQSGSWANAGTGKVGTGGIAPKIFGLGFPNIGNPVSFQIVDTIEPSPAVFALGFPSSIAVPQIGTFYSWPIFATIPKQTYGNTVTGFVSTELGIPFLPATAGASFVVQGWILDPVATVGLSHTDQLTITIGN